MLRSVGCFVIFFTFWGCAAVEPGPEYDSRCLLSVAFRPEIELARTDIHLTREQAESPELIGSFSGFQTPGYRRFAERYSVQGTRYLLLSLPLPPGPYKYGFIVGNEFLPDSLNPHSEFGKNPLQNRSAPYEAEWSSQDLADCRLPTLSVTSLQVEDATSLDQNDGKISVRFRIEDGIETALPNFPTVTVSKDGQPVSSPQISLLSEKEYEVSLSALATGKYHIEWEVTDLAHAVSLKKNVFALVAPKRKRSEHSFSGARADTVIYHILVDRFRGDRGPLSAPLTPGHRAGGTLKGVLSAVENGYFERLSVTTLWLSPLYQNPVGMLRGRDGKMYESYHGYWPAAPRSLEANLGTDRDLEQLVQTAHRRGLRVIFDAVPNHVYFGHPYYKEHGSLSPASQPDPAKKSWFSDGENACVCGGPDCGWGERIEDCWFDSYLPDVNLRNPEAAAQQRSDLLWWMNRFDLDGMRIDAVPMMPRNFTRSVVKAVSLQAVRRGLDVLLIGEDFTGPGDRGRYEIRSFLGDRFDGLHSAFDFPLFWSTVDALAKDRIPLTALERQLDLSEKVYGGSGAVMGKMLNNHDTARFVSEAAGNAGNDPWKFPPGQPTEAEPYQRQKLGLAFLFTIPGIPVLYYGDEIGLAGARDPDSRRVLPDVLADNLSALQKDVLTYTERLGNLRQCLAVLRRGKRTVLQSDAEYTVALHTAEAGGDREYAFSVLSRNSGERVAQVANLPPGNYRDVLSNEHLTVPENGVAPVLLRSLRAQIFLPAFSRCIPEAHK